MREIDGRVAVVTGGSSGIGRGIALALARAGMKVVIVGRRAEALAETAATLAALDVEVTTISADVTDLAAMRAAADEVDRRFGRVDVLVNNAGIGLSGAISDALPGDWDWVIDVNIKGVANGIMAFLPRIRRGGVGGYVVNTASMSGLMPVVAGLYSMTKAAVIALSEALHIELAEEGIGVSAFCPGPTHSDIAAGSARRPSFYGPSGYPGPREPANGTPAAQPYMSAEEAGERVLYGMLRGDLFILTHPEFRKGVADRSALISSAFPEEGIDEVRAAAIGFLLESRVYSPDERLPPPRFSSGRGSSSAR